MIEISVIERNALGEPILDSNGNPKKKTFCSDNGDNISDFWMRNSPKSVSPSNKKSGSANTVNKRQFEKIVRTKKRFDDGSNK